jgi:hypothetical protein
MKKLIIIIFIGFAVWQFYLKDSGVVETSKDKAVSTFQNSAAMQTLAKARELAHTQSIYKCDGRKSCSQMTSLKEAEFFIKYCPNSQLNKDKNGVVCGKHFLN